MGGTVFIHLADVSGLVRRDPAQQREHQATSRNKQLGGGKPLNQLCHQRKTSSADTLMASQPSMASQTPLSYILVDHYLCKSRYVSWLETHHQVSTGSPPETLPVLLGPFPFSPVGWMKASHGCAENLHASRVGCHSMGFIKKRFLGDVNPMRNQEMVSDAPLGRGL